MTARNGRERIGYEAALRAIGRNLDGLPVYYLSIVEVDDGFVVRWNPTLHQTESRAVHVAWPQVAELGVFNRAGRDGRPRTRRHQGIWHSFPGGHEDGLRALGYVLDSALARDVSLDECPEAIAIAYLPRRLQGGQPRKVYHLYDRRQMEQLCREARGRRGVRRIEAV